MTTMEFAPDQVEVLLFDLGGVVIDIDFGRCLRRWGEDSGRDVAELAAAFTFDEAYERHETGDLDAAGYFASLRLGLRLGLTDEELVAGWNDIWIGANPNVVALLATAGTAYPLYAFSNSNPTHQSVWAERFADELTAFRTVFVSSELGERKPDRAAFDLVAARMDVDPAHVLFFDDGAENVDGAIAAGMQAVHVTSTDSVSDALARLDLTP